MTDFKTSKILVTGAGGQLGRRVVELLVEAGASNVVAGSRDPGKLNIAGVESRKVDFSDAAGLDAAFAGVDTLLLISVDVLGEVRQKLQTTAVAAAKRAGVKHIVYTSLTNPGPESAVLLAPDHHITEEAIKATGIPFTFLRNAVYMDMLLQALPHAVASGQWYTAQGQGKIARITRDDCARAAAAALLAAPQGVVDVAGGELLTADETAAIVSDVVGKPLTVVHVDDKSLAAGMVGAGMPQEFADLLVSFETATRLGQTAVASQFKALTGQQPTSVRDFLAANKAALVA
jgi:NAD(P)H dehydrogenase (quinone)